MKTSELVDSLFAKGYEVRRDLVNGEDGIVFSKGSIEWIVWPSDPSPWVVKYDLDDMSEFDGPRWEEFRIERMEESDV